MTVRAMVTKNTSFIWAESNRILNPLGEDWALNDFLIYILVESGVSCLVNCI